MCKGLFSYFLWDEFENIMQKSFECSSEANHVGNCMRKQI